MAAAVAALLVVGVLALVLAPLALADAAGPEAAPDETLENRRDDLLAQLKDLDLDLAMGKVAPDDHAAMRRTLEDEAASVLSALDDARGPAEGQPR